MMPGQYTARHWGADPRRWAPSERRYAGMLRSYRHWARTRRRGAQVLVCYDGKQGRAVPGQVLRSRKGVLTVQFPRYAGQELLTLRFVNGEAYDRGGTVQGGIARLVGGAARRERGDLYVLAPSLQEKRS